MDTIFALDHESRVRILERAAARVPGCAYLCVWAPILQPPSSRLRCMDVWLGNGGRGDRVRALFDAYRVSCCEIVSGCVPGWAYKDGREYMEVREPDLTASASLPVQQQFYEEAGIKMAVFMGCQSGEIEVGMSTAPAPANVQQLFSEDFVQQSLLEELLQMPPTRPSSSSSSLPSLSVGSPEYSSLIRSIATSVPPPAAEMASSQDPRPLLHPRLQHRLHVPDYGQYGHIQFRSPNADDAAMARAMLAVISSSVPPSSPTPPPPRRPTPPIHRDLRLSPRRATAFKPYNVAVSPRAEPMPGAPGQRLTKMCMSVLRRIHMLASPRQQEEDEVEPQVPTSSQLNHMISERRRRERLNESFQALRGLLPPGSKSDKATVLARTREYMSTLIAQVSELEQRNRMLEAQVRQRQVGSSTERVLQAQAGGSSERIQVQVASGASSSTSESREVRIRVAVRAECDLSDLVIRVLQRLKEMGKFVVVSVDARQEGNGHAEANLTLRVTAGECDEASLKEAVTKVVEDTVTPSGES